MKKRTSQLALIFSLTASIAFTSIGFAQGTGDSVTPEIRTSLEQQTTFQAEQLAEKHRKILPKLRKIEETLEATPEDDLGGIYFEGDRAYVQIVDKHQLTSKAKISSAIGDSFEIIYKSVKHSKKELEDAVEKLNNIIKDDNSAWGIDTKNNKVIVFSQDNEVKKKILMNFGSELVSFGPSLVSIEDQVGVGPATTINNGEGYCTVAFTGTVGTSKVAVTAGHCRQKLNETWKVGTTNIGTFTKVASTSGSTDAGYITLNSNTTTNFNDSASGTPIIGAGSTDYQGLSLSVNAGSQKVPVQVAVVGVSVGGFTNQRLCSFTTSAKTVSGQSGAPVVSRYYNSDIKRYEEVVYGIHKGLIELSDGSQYELYSNASFALTNLGVKGNWAS